MNSFLPEVKSSLTMWEFHRAASGSGCPSGLIVSAKRAGVMATKGLQGEKSILRTLRTSQVAYTFSWKRKFREGTKTGPGAVMDEGAFCQEFGQLEPIRKRLRVQIKVSFLNLELSREE